MAVSVGVVGAGTISQFHFRAFRNMGATVRVVADPNRQAAEPHLTAFGADYADDYRAVIDRADVDVVTVFTSSPLHYEICKAALDGGKHVICEKTLTLSPKQSYELGKLAEDRGLVLFTSYMKRFFPAVQKAKDLMERIGHVTSVYCRTYQGLGGADAHTGEVPSAFAPDANGRVPILGMAGGGVLICGGSHVFNLLLYLVGKPTSLYGRRFVRQSPDVDMMSHAICDLPGGGVVHFEANWHPLKRIGFEGNGWDEGFEISGVNGRIVLNTPLWDHPERNPARVRYYDNESETWAEYRFDIVCPFEQAERYFLEHIEEGRAGEGAMDRYDGYRTDLLLETARKSAEENRPITLEWDA